MKLGPAARSVAEGIFQDRERAAELAVADLTNNGTLIIFTLLTEDLGRPRRAHLWSTLPRRSRARWTASRHSVRLQGGVWSSPTARDCKAIRSGSDSTSLSRGNRARSPAALRQRRAEALAVRVDCNTASVSDGTLLDHARLWKGVSEQLQEVTDGVGLDGSFEGVPAPTASGAFGEEADRHLLRRSTTTIRVRSIVRPPVFENVFEAQSAADADDTSQGLRGIDAPTVHVVFTKLH